MNKMYLVLVALVLFFGMPGTAVSLPGLEVLAVSPSRNSTTVLPGATLSVAWSRHLNMSTVGSSSIIIRGSQTGTLYSANASFTLSPGSDTLLVIDPAEDFKPGEEITVTLTTGIEGTLGEPLVEPYSWTFRVQSASGSVSGFSEYILAKSNVVNAVFIADLNNDGVNDFAMPESTNTRHYAGVNTGGSTFTTATVTLPLNWNRGSVGDMDGDGNLDFVGSSFTSFNVVYGDGTGIGYSTSASIAYGTSIFHYGSALADYDGDGDLDASLVHSTNVLLFHNTSGVFALSTVNTTRTIAFHVNGDFNNDGLIDIVTVSSTNFSVWGLDFVRNNGGGSFAVHTTSTLGVIGGFSKLSRADINGDGNLDIIIGAHNQNIVPIICYGSGTGTFATSTNSNLSTSWTGVFPADVDGDGDIDLIGVEPMAGNTGSTIVVSTNQGSGVFGSGVTVATGSFYTPNSLIMSAGDLNDDGATDILVSSDVSSAPARIFFSTPTVPGMVTNTNNSGPGSLRYALENATTGSVITFANGITPHFTITGGPIHIQSLLSLDFSNLGGITIEAVGGGPAILFSCDAVGSQLRNVTVIGSVVSDCSDMRPVYIRNNRPN